MPKPIKSDFDYIMEKLCSGFSKVIVDRLEKAYDYARKKHGQQKRKSSDVLYIVHPVRVAILVKESYINQKIPIGDKECRVLEAALLHDVIEDCAKGDVYKIQVLSQEIESNFGSTVLRLVHELTDDKTLKRWRRKVLQYANAKNKSNDARRIELADKVDNCRDLQRVPISTWTVNKIEGYFTWCYLIRIELGGISPYLESEMDTVCRESFIDPQSGMPIPCIPESQLWHQTLYDYYAICAKEEKDEEAFQQYCDRRQNLCSADTQSAPFVSIE